MSPVLLLFALQFQAPAVSATGADSAVVRTMLQTGVAAFDSFNGNASWYDVGRRYMEQLHLWGMKDEGSRAAFRFDSAVTRTHRSGTTVNTYYWLSQLIHSGDTVNADRFIARMPEATADEVIALVAKDLMTQRPAMASRLEARLTKPWPRADLLHHRALYVLPRTDSVAARAMLAEAITLARTDTVFGTYAAWTWMVELLRLGGQVAIDDIIEAAIRPEGDLWNARFAVADALGRDMMPQARSALVDSLVAGIESQEPTRQPYSRMRLLQLTGTKPDSARAMVLRDSLDTAQNPDPNRVRQLRGERLSRDLYESATQLDVSRLRAALSRPASDTVLATVLNHVRVLTTLQLDYRPTYRDELTTYTRVLIDLTDPMLRVLPTAVRDSIHVFRAALVSYLSAPEGLTFARSIPTDRFRDRAVGEVITRLVRVDADLAEREAASLRDSVALGIAFGALTQAAVAGGRLSAAARFAANATGEARARALFVVASAQQKSGLLEDARRTISAAFGSIDPQPRCDGCIIVVTTQKTRPQAIGTEPALLAETIFLALHLGMRDQVLSWARSQQDAPRIANAHCVVVEAMSRQLLGWQAGPRLR